MLDFTAKNVKKGRITVKIASKWLFLGENKEIIYKSTLILLKILHWIHSDHRKNKLGARTLGARSRGRLCLRLCLDFI